MSIARWIIDENKHAYLVADAADRDEALKRFAEVGGKVILDLPATECPKCGLYLNPTLINWKEIQYHIEPLSDAMGSHFREDPCPFMPEDY